MKIIKSRILNLVVFGFITTTTLAHNSGEIVVKDAWVREGPPNVKVLAAYMTIENHTDKEKALSSITSPVFKKIEIHHTIYKEGMASMQQMQHLAIPAEGKVTLKPGGSHLMLFIPSRQLKVGDNVDFTLKFASGSTTMITATVKKATGSHHHGQHDDHSKHDMKKEGTKNDSHEHGSHNH